MTGPATARRAGATAGRSDGPAHRPFRPDTCRSADEFRELRRRYRGFAFPWTVAFLTWYLLYVVMSNWAGDFMDLRLVGNINVALVFGLLQFVSTFGIAWLYARHANRELDPVATDLERRYAAEVAALEDRPRGAR